MNQPSVTDTRRLDPPGRDDSRNRGGRLHLTASILIQHEDLDAALRFHAAGLRWNKNLVDILREHQESKQLSRAIESSFNDIADRKRVLFDAEFLIDTRSIDELEPLHGPNVCQIVDIDMPKSAEWAAEGKRLRMDFAHPVRFESVVCRAFWVAHSNQSMSYHLSFEISYEHDASHYYALSLLQKVFFPTEETLKIYEAGEGWPTVTPVGERNPTSAKRFPEYLASRFERDAVDLFQEILDNVKPSSRRANGGEIVRFLLPQNEQEKPARLTKWDRKCLAVLEDPYFFQLLQADRRRDLTSLESVVPSVNEDGVLCYDGENLDAQDPDGLAYYFLSGFFQNVIDFLRQDIAEVSDAIDPIYPSAAAHDDSGYFVVYANPVALYEVVSQSRSLSEGKGWIGTCPYLFLVHLMTLHNEALVRRYERQVRGLVDHLEEVHLLGSDDRPGSRRKPWKSEETFQRFRRFRLTMFDEVHRHRYFNVLRYETEQEIYRSVEEVRGIQQREQYWSEVVSELENTVDDLRAAQQRGFDDWRNKLLAAVTVIGVLQVAFELLDYFFEKGAAQIRWGVGMAAVAVILASNLIRPWLRFPRRRS